MRKVSDASDETYPGNDHVLEQANQQGAQLRPTRMAILGAVLLATAGLHFYLTSVMVRNYSGHKYWSIVPAVGGGILTFYGAVNVKAARQLKQGKTISTFQPGQERLHFYQQSVGAICFLAVAALQFYLTSVVVRNFSEHKYWSIVPAVGGGVLTLYGVTAAILAGINRRLAAQAQDD
jgi:hypothetical protein